MNYTVAELFAGVGGFRIGLEKCENFKVVFSNQYEPSTKKQHASEIYSATFGSFGHSNKDIALVKTEDIPDVDILVGGFPCQDYSIANTLKNSKGLIGKKGILWWQIYRILEEKENKPKILILENVDRLINSPSNQKGRDFAIILSTLNSLGYIVEWKVINAADYGMPQKRKRTFIYAVLKDSDFASRYNGEPIDLLNNSLLSKAFPNIILEDNDIISGNIHSDLIELSDSFNKENNKVFLDTGIMIDGKYYTSKYKSSYNGYMTVLRDILQDESDVPEEYYLKDDEIDKWKDLKGTKSFERVSKSTGHKYMYRQGKMSFPDSLDKPSRTIVTVEGGSSPSRFKHVVMVNNRYRRLTPVELERLNMFPDNHTLGVSDSKRAFLMGNALVTGVITNIAEQINKCYNY